MIWNLEINFQFNPFQCSVAFHIETWFELQIKWLVSMWNATQGWNWLKVTPYIHTNSLFFKIWGKLNLKATHSLSFNFFKIIEDVIILFFKDIAIMIRKIFPFFPWILGERWFTESPWFYSTAKNTDATFFTIIHTHFFNYKVDF